MNHHASPLPVGATEKKCSNCHEVKSLAEFYARNDKNTRGYSSRCVACERERARKRREDPIHRQYHRDYSREWIAERPEKIAEYSAAYHRLNPGQSARQHRLRRYGLTDEDALALLANQDWRCAICPTPLKLIGKGGAHIDHDHKTGVVRGLLCGPCNRGIGIMCDDPVRLIAAADYLTRNANTQLQIVT